MPKKKGNPQSRGRSGGRTTSAPAARSTMTKSGHAMVQHTRDGVKVRHKELVSAVAGSAGYAVAEFAINAGLEASFPWLAGVAAGYEMYKFGKLVYKYVTRSPTTKGGAVLMSPDYNALDEAPLDEAEQASQAGCMECSTWQNCSMVVDTKRHGGWKYVRQHNVYGSDKKTYDLGKINIGRVGQDDTTDIGKLWAEYEVELKTPTTRVPATVRPKTNRVATWKTSASQALTNGSWVTVAYDNQIEADYLVGSGITRATNTFLLPRGVWMVHYRMLYKFAHSTGGQDMKLESKIVRGGNSGPYGEVVYRDHSMPSADSHRETTDTQIICVADQTTVYAQAKASYTGSWTTVELHVASTQFSTIIFHGIAM